MKFYLSVLAAMLAVAACAPDTFTTKTSSAAATLPTDEKVILCGDKGWTCGKGYDPCCSGLSCQTIDGKQKCEKKPSDDGSTAETRDAKCIPLDQKCGAEMGPFCCEGTECKDVKEDGKESKKCIKSTFSRLSKNKVRDADTCAEPGSSCSKDNECCQVKDIGCVKGTCKQVIMTGPPSKI